MKSSPEIPIGIGRSCLSRMYSWVFQTGFPMVHILGDLNGTPVDITFHPEKVESLNTLRPLQQMENGINPSDIQCKEGQDVYMRTYNESALCLRPDSAEKLMQLGVVDLF